MICKFQNLWCGFGGENAQCMAERLNTERKIKGDLKIVHINDLELFFWFLKSLYLSADLSVNAKFEVISCKIHKNHKSRRFKDLERH